jgi:hypothetical protein
MKGLLQRRLLVATALLSPFVVALSLAVPTAQAMYVRGHIAARGLGRGTAGVVHGVAPAVIIAIGAGVFVALVFVAAVVSSRRAAAVAAIVQMPVRSDTSASAGRKAA